MKRLIFFLSIALLVFGCKDDGPEDIWTHIGGKYKGSITYSNDNGLFSYEENIPYTVVRNGNTATITFHYADDTGDVTLQLTDLYASGHEGVGALAFKIKEQMAGEKIQHKFTGLPVGYGLIADYDGYFTYQNQVLIVKFGTSLHTHYNDDMRMGVSALKDLVQ